jgi:SAM-dependent methyltransferase
MAITNNEVSFLCYCKETGVNFVNTLTLGRLRLYIRINELNLDALRTVVPELKSADFKNDYSEVFFQRLGAEKLDSIDYSLYENATMAHDMNLPVDSALHNNYDAVVDAGTLEHIFNFPVAISNCMKLLKEGGHFIGISPVNSLMGHGFYQFSPELYYRIFSPENGFEVVKMIITSAKGSSADWYEVADPAKIGERAELSSQTSAYMLVIARKIQSKEIFRIYPQQSDYADLWQKKSNIKEHQQAGILLKYYQLFIPAKMRAAFYRFRKLNRMVTTNDLGKVNPRAFKKMKRII